MNAASRPPFVRREAVDKCARDLESRRGSIRSAELAEEGAMTISVEALWKMSDVELLAAYHDARRRFAEGRFARDTERARLEWLRARAFAATSGGVSERRNVVDSSEDLARKAQQVREMTRDLDLLKAEIDVTAMVVRLRGAFAPSAAPVDDAPEDEDKAE